MTKLVHITTVPQSLYQFLWGQVEYVRAHGFEIHAISSSNEWLERFSVRDHVPVYAVEMPRDIEPIGDFIAVIGLFRALRRIRPDIVQAGTPQGGLLGTVAAWLARVPVRIYQIHGLPFTTFTGPKRSLLRWTEKLSCRLANRVLCVSHSIREVVIEEGICSANKIVVLQGGGCNGIDAQKRFNPARRPAGERDLIRDQFGIPADAPVLGFVGRLVKIKGIVELAAMWTSLREERLDLHLLAVGPLEDHAPIPDEIAEMLRRDPRVHLTDRVIDAVPYYTAIDVLVLPTHREGLPSVLLEAASMEVASVATSVPGCTDVIVNGETGTLVPLGDIDALGAAVRRYLNDAELRLRHGRAARQRVLQAFQQEAIWDALICEYARLLRAQGLQVPPEITADAEQVAVAPREPVSDEPL
jgi:glycosyltransferase involved in cell wall biosynthesis